MTFGLVDNGLSCRSKMLVFVAILLSFRCIDTVICCICLSFSVNGIGRKWEFCVFSLQAETFVPTLRDYVCVS